VLINTWALKLVLLSRSTGTMRPSDDGAAFRLCVWPYRYCCRSLHCDEERTCVHLYSLSLSRLATTTVGLESGASAMN
jgi:hypothetical protein